MKYKVGDIFKIKLDDRLYGFGQIVRIPDKESITVVAFKQTSMNDSENLDYSCPRGVWP